MKVRKAIIPAAGLGTRFLPATKAQPKEMLPIVDKPTIQYIVEEAAVSGIEDIIIVTGRGKRAIEDHFDKSYELEETLVKRGKTALLQSMRNISELSNIHYIRQKEPKGLGDAVYCAHRFIGNEPFAVLLGDDIVQSEVPCLKQLIDVYHTYNLPVIGVQHVQQEDVSKYGIIALKETIHENEVHTISRLVEKPTAEEAPSSLAIMGRYVLPPAIFPILETQEPGRAGEIQLTDALNTLNHSSPLLAYTFEGKRYDVGDKLNFIKATIEFALKREDLQKPLFDYLKKVLEE
ncbi:UTP--glucose-1-phosphate uridylyltransferase GalU [Bacillus taeanensis]|uniref:UTP--glucose-1-phosphate uridylyltransferase n=1 Tax=Bacillus taeanensis TaxID=273032 RepID=A0A366XS69_9BACI|nr:UTP--glucose-1-phosphate uridylyltransferase GalU [Bacillus taeanensis]RBW67609.1 UTP--glucose-1-phosphate uridylyltransferase [Bacillus taeanensis]